MPLQNVEIYPLINHLGNHNLVRPNTLAGSSFVRYSLPRPPGTLNIAGAGDVGKIETEGGSQVVWIES